MKKSLSIAVSGLFLAASLGAASAQSSGGDSGAGAGSGKINNSITGQPTTPQAGTMNSGSKIDATTKTKAEGSQAGKSGSDNGQTNAVINGTKNPNASSSTMGAGTSGAAGGERKDKDGAGTTTQTK